MCTGPKPYPKEFRDDVVRGARDREAGQQLKQTAADFGSSESCLTSWVKAAALRTPRSLVWPPTRRQNCVSCVAETGCWSRRTRSCAGLLCICRSRTCQEMIYPLVRELADDGIPAPVMCRILNIARQPYYRWLEQPATDAEFEEAYHGESAVPTRTRTIQSLVTGSWPIIYFNSISVAEHAVMQILALCDRRVGHRLQSPLATARTEIVPERWRHARDWPSNSSCRRGCTTPATATPTPPAESPPNTTAATYPASAPAWRVTSANPPPTVAKVVTPPTDAPTSTRPPTVVTLRTRPPREKRPATSCTLHAGFDTETPNPW